MQIYIKLLTIDSILTLLNTINFIHGVTILFITHFIVHTIIEQKVSIITFWKYQN